MNDQLPKETVSIASLFGTYQPILEQKIERQKHSKTDMQKCVTAIANEFCMDKQMTGSLFKYLQFQANLTFDEIEECVKKCRTWKVNTTAQSHWLWTLLRQKSNEIKKLM